MAIKTNYMKLVESLSSDCQYVYLQEKFADTMRSLHEDKRKLEGELKKARTDREAAEDKLAELKLQHDSLQELMATLKDGKGAAKVTEWHAKMGEIRLQDLKLNRAISRLQEEVLTKRATFVPPNWLK